MQNILNTLNRIEIPGLLVWLLVLLGHFTLGYNLTLPITIISGVLGAMYLYQGKFAMKLLATQKMLVKVFPYVFGIASSVLVFGVMCKALNYPGASIMLNAGMVALLTSCVMLFYTPVQNEFLPVMKKLLLRILILIAIGFWFSMI